MKVMSIEYDYDVCPDISREFALACYIADIDIETIKQITKKQSRILRQRFNNLNGYGVYYNDDCIIITSDSANRNWSYYAGFEYVDKEYINVLNINGSVIGVYFNDSDRVSDIIEILKESEEEGEE